MKVAKWGNSLAVRLPAALVDELDLKIGDDIEILSPGKRPKTAAAKRSIRVKKAKSRRELLAELRKYRGMIPADFKFDRDEANER